MSGNNAMKITTIIRFILIGIIVLLIGALSGWYFYLSSRNAAHGSSASIGGLGAALSFNGSGGSTQHNQQIASGITTASTAAASSASSSSPLWEVDPAPVAGMGFLSGSSTQLVYIERANGYVFNADPATHGNGRVTNTLMPKIYRAYVSGDGAILERAIDDSGTITTFLGSVATATATSSGSATLSGIYLQPNLLQVALNTKNNALFYLAANSKGGVDGFIQSWNGTKATKIFSSVVGSWNVSYLADGRIILLESPQDGIPGYAYTLSSNGSLNPLLASGVPGLTILPQSGGKDLVYGSADGTSVSLFTLATTSPVVTTLQTVADKCVWMPGISMIVYCAVPVSAPQENFLSQWYQGIAHTADNWWKIDLSDGQEALVYSPGSGGASLDVQNPVMDPTGTYIAFQNSVDGSLWVLNVTMTQ